MCVNNTSEKFHCEEEQRILSSFLVIGFFLSYENGVDWVYSHVWLLECSTKFVAHS